MVGRSAHAARRVALAAVVCALAGCAAPVLAPQTAPAAFELTARFAVSYRGEAASGSVAWRWAEGAEELRIGSTLGQGVAHIRREGAEFVLTTADGRRYRATDAEGLTEQALGFRLPLAGLADWVRARPAPGPSRARLDAEGRLAQLEQSGWTIDYLEYAGARPVRLRLAYPGIELRLAIGEWK
ncbi:MAG: lipoprotein insertase outer membrane protein LolB [Burkholderiales bacterium]|nr:lipoprotein insertase outer membrane protein LolB [Burkholderiales bacterium]